LYFSVTWMHWCLTGSCSKRNCWLWFWSSWLGLFSEAVCWDLCCQIQDWCAQAHEETLGRQLLSSQRKEMEQVRRRWIRPWFQPVCTWPYFQGTLSWQLRSKMFECYCIHMFCYQPIDVSVSTDWQVRAIIIHRT